MSSTGHNVMVIDDAAFMRRLIAAALSRLPDVGQVHAFADGPLGLAGLETVSPSLVILDLEMPRMDGLTVLRHLRERIPQTPVVMLSSAGTLRPDAASRALDLGAAAFIDKPTHSPHLEDSLRQLTSQFQVLLPNLAAPPVPGDSLAALVVDDSRINRHLLSRLLGQLGHHVTVAEDGAVALAAWLGAHFEAVFMDSEMPHLDGYEATRRMRAIEHDAHRAPARFVAITASAADAETRQRCLAAGMDSFLPRPFTLDALHRVLSPASPPQLLAS